VLVNDRIDIAIACRAAGVHLRADSVPAAAVRAIAPAGFVVGRSVHAVVEAVEAAPFVDYLIAGTVWPSGSKASEHEVIGTAGLAAIASTAGVPVLAIGGVTIARMAPAARAGAAGIAAIDLFMVEPDARTGCRGGSLFEVVKAARSVFDTIGTAS